MYRQAERGKKTELCARLENTFRTRGNSLTPGLRFTVMKDQLAIAAKTLRNKEKGTKVVVYSI